MEASYRRPHSKDLNRLAEVYNYAVSATAAAFDTAEMTPEDFIYTQYHNGRPIHNLPN